MMVFSYGVIYNAIRKAEQVKQIDKPQYKRKYPKYMGASIPNI